MLNEQTVGRLQALRLTTLATAWAEQQRQTDMHGLSFDERLGLLVEAEWLARENKRTDQRRKDAKLKLSQACIENIDYPARRELDRAVVRQLATGRWIEEHQGLIITGPTGTRIFEDPTILIGRYTSQQIGFGLNYMGQAIYSSHLRAFVNAGVPLELRVRGVRAIGQLYARLFAALIDPDASAVEAMATSSKRSSSTGKRVDEVLGRVGHRPLLV